MSERIEILGVKIHKVTFDEAEEIIWNFLKEGLNKYSVYTPNSEMIMEAQKDTELMSILNTGSLCTADGIGVVYASKIVGNPLKERVTGFDLARRVVEKLAGTGYSLYLFGGAPNVALDAKVSLINDFPGINIVGTSDGYFDSEKEKKIIQDINEKKPDIIFVCLGMGKQEKWIHNNIQNLNTKVCMGIGGTIDVFAGKAKRAPEFFCKYGIEWLYRFIKEPWRYKRMLSLPRFALKVLLYGKK